MQKVHACTSATVGFIGAAISSYNVIREIKELPEAFKEVERQLPLVHNILINIEQRLASSPITDADKPMLQELIVPCQNDAKALKEIFERMAKKCVEDQNGTKTWPKARAWYREALRGVKAHQVESLMKTILDRVQLLVSEKIFNLHDDSVQIKEALQKLSEIDASLEDSELEMGAIHAQQTIQDQATGTQVNSSGGVVNTGPHSGNTNTYNGPVTIFSCSHRNFQENLPQPPKRKPEYQGRPKASCHIPIGKNARFTGRVKIMQKLQTTIHGKQCELIALFGLGGVGKSEIALSFAHWVKDTLPDHSVFWISALSSGSIDKSYGDIARKLGLPNSKGVGVKLELQQYLSSGNASPWLLIVDNADDEDILESMLRDEDGNSALPQDNHCLTLFTTRSRDVAQKFSQGNVIDVEAMDEDDAKNLLAKLIGKQRRGESDETVKALLEKLTYLPLAIAHAAAYMDRNGKSISDYVNLMASANGDLIKLLEQKMATGKEMTSVLTTWAISFQQINTHHPQAATLLLFLSQIEPKGIPRTILPNFASEVELDQAIGTLLGYAFIRDRGDKQQTFDMHSLVHLGAKIWVERQGQEYTKRLIENCMTRLQEVVFGEGTLVERVMRFGDEHLPHALKLLKASEDLRLNSELQATFYWGIGTALLYLRPRPCPEGIRLLRQGLQLAENENFHQFVPIFQATEACAILEDYPETFAMLDNSSALEETERAVKLAQSAVEVYRLTHSAAYIPFMLVQLTLAGLYISMNRQNDAIPLIHSVFETYNTVDIYQDCNGLSLPPVLALRLSDIGQSSEAIAILEKTVKKHEELVERGKIGECTPELIEAKVFLAALYVDLDESDTQSAVDRFEEIWQLATKYYGRVSHLKVIQIQTLLGMMYNLNGEYKKALKVLKEVVKLCEEDAALAGSPTAVFARSSLAEYQSSSRWTTMSLRVSIRIKSVSRRLNWNKK